MSQNLTTIRRDTNVLTQNVSTGGSFALGAYAGAMLLCVSGTATVKFTVKKTEADATGYDLRTAYGDLLTLSVTSGNAYPLPDEAYCAPVIVLTATSGSATFQVVLKG